MNSLPKTVTRQRRDCDLNPGPSAPEPSTLTTRLPNHPMDHNYISNICLLRMNDHVTAAQSREAGGISVHINNRAKNDEKPRNDYCSGMTMEEMYSESRGYACLRACMEQTSATHENSSFRLVSVGFRATRYLDPLRPDHKQQPKRCQ